MPLIQSFFVQSAKDPLDVISWVSRKSEIVDIQGNSVFMRDKILVPDFWSQNAIDVAVSKYLRKTGVPQADGSLGGETSIREMIERVVNLIEQTGLQHKYFETQEEAQVFSRELKYILVHQLGSFNSPVWFNCGLAQAYGLKGRGGNFRWDCSSHQVVSCENTYEFPQTSACFIQSVTPETISDLARKERQIFKYGSGSGTNFSGLFGRREATEDGAGFSSLISALELLDRGAASIKSGGVSRRAAKMVCLDLDHPDIVEFIQWKLQEEKKARALIKSGMDSHYEGESYSIVSGQNSNNSIRIPDSFFHHLEENQKWLLKSRLNGEALDSVSAQTLWDLIGEAAWECADPGVQFSDTIEKWNPCKGSGKIMASNPCSEYMFLDETACNLASLNLVQFLQPTGAMDWEAYRHACDVLFLSQDILIQTSSYPTVEITQKTHQLRPIGLGYTNLGAFLMQKGLAYGGGEACQWTSRLSAELQTQAFNMSSKLGDLLGEFPSYQENRSDFIKVMKMHQTAVHQILDEDFWNDDLQNLKNSWVQGLEKLETSGVRNSQLSVLAPTGTIGILMDCDTLGIEPEYSLMKKKILSGGGEMTIPNRSLLPALQSLEYSDEEIEEIMNFLKTNGGLEGAPHIQQDHLEVFDCAIPQPGGERFLSVEQHLNMMEAAQPFLSGAMSKTVNLPGSAKVEDIKEVYLSAWERGLKSVAIYRDGSKASQPMNILNREISKKPG